MTAGIHAASGARHLERACDESGRVLQRRDALLRFGVCVAHLHSGLGADLGDGPEGSTILQVPFWQGFRGRLPFLPHGRVCAWIQINRPHRRLLQELNHPDSLFLDGKRVRPATEIRFIVIRNVRNLCLSCRRRGHRVQV